MRPILCHQPPQAVLCRQDFQDLRTAGGGDFLRDVGRPGIAVLSFSFQVVKDLLFLVVEVGRGCSLMAMSMGAKLDVFFLSIRYGRSFAF